MKRIGIGMTILGIMMIAGSMSLLLRNRTEEAQAAQSVRDVMVQMETAATVPPSAEEPRENPDREMPAVRIGEHDYIGYIRIPVLELELPVMEQWSYDRLRAAPCRYAGSLYREDLVVMAHNYESHFGRLDELKPGDPVAFTDMEGRTVIFRVEAVEILESGAVEEMTAGEYGLTLFTCTYGGKRRVTVRCGRATD